MEPAKISKKLLGRLSLYLDQLKKLPEDSENISATTLAKALGLGEVQVRKDLAKISSTGRCRTGRNREQLLRDIENYLERTTETGTIIVGSGDLGQALLDDGTFQDAGLNVMAGFDILPVEKHTGSGKPIYPMNRLETFCRRYDVHIGIITVPADRAQTVCDCLVACGIKSIWNYAPVQLKVPEYVLVHSKTASPLLRQPAHRNPVQ